MDATLGPIDVRLDVTDAVAPRLRGGRAGAAGERGADARLVQTAWLFAPRDPGPAPRVLVCLAGGSYDKRYWHADVPGRDGYSFARHLAGLGFVVLALDHLGTGGSSDPTGASAVDLALLRDGDVAAIAEARRRAERGALCDALPPLANAAWIGVGHSLGACLTTMVQASARPFEAVALLGYTVDVAGLQGDDAGGAALGSDDAALAARVLASERRLRASSGAPDDALSTRLDRARTRALFHAPDVPDDVVAADDAAATRLPVRAAAEVTTEGFVGRFAAAIDVPVFLGIGGGVDVSPAPHREPAAFPAARDVTLFVLEGAAHCHNFASGRHRLWDRLAAWAASLPPRG